MSIMMALSNMAGIGGGGAVVPLLMAFFGFDTKAAIPISGVTILMGSMTRFVLNFNEKHPDKEAVSLDYGLAAVMLPTVVIGSILGAYFYIILPSPIILIVLTCLFIFFAA